MQTYEDHSWRLKRNFGVGGLRSAVRARDGQGLQVLGSDEIASTVFLEW